MATTGADTSHIIYERPVPVHYPYLLSEFEPNRAHCPLELIHDLHNLMPTNFFITTSYTLRILRKKGIVIQVCFARFSSLHLNAHASETYTAGARSRIVQCNAIAMDALPLWAHFTATLNSESTAKRIQNQNFPIINHLLCACAYVFIQFECCYEAQQTLYLTI